jgi:hypothetical protein
MHNTNRDETNQERKKLSNGTEVVIVVVLE